MAWHNRKLAEMMTILVTKPERGHKLRRRKLFGVTKWINRLVSGAPKTFLQYHICVIMIYIVCDYDRRQKGINIMIPLIRRWHKAPHCSHLIRTLSITWSILDCGILVKSRTSHQALAKTFLRQICFMITEGHQDHDFFQTMDAPLLQIPYCISATMLKD